MTTTTPVWTQIHGARKPETYTHGLGERIRALRLYMGLSQRDLAERVGKDRRDFQRIENGRDACPPGMLSQIETLADAFDIMVDAVLAQARLHFEAEGTPLKISVVTDGRPENEWPRLVAGRAAAENTEGAPVELVAYDTARAVQNPV